MDQSWAVDFLDVLQSRYHFGDVVTVDGTDVLEPQALEKKPRRHQAQEGVLQFARRMFKVLSPGETQKPTRQLLLHTHTEIRGKLFAQERGNRTDTRVDKNCIVIENDD